tara:strand:+ start:127 stop:1836 length:1710 start_codon:yes stop_codon:yes gene_type:complete
MNRKNIILQAIYRVIPIIFVILIGLIGINNGIYFKDIPDIGDDSFVVQLYYIASLFLMSGIDLGMPIGESDFYRILVLAAYLLAPIIAVTSVIEAIFRSIDPNFFKRKYKDHIIIIGASALTVSRVDYLKELKEKIIIVDNNSDNVNLEYFKKLNNIRFIIEDYNSPNLLEKLNIDFCKSIWLLTDDDFLNIEFSLKIKNTYPDFDMQNLEVRCESNILNTDIAVHPEMKKVLSKRGAKNAKGKLISNNQSLANIFYYKYFYQLRDADNIVIYGCNDFTDALIKVFVMAGRKKKGGETKKYPFNIKKIIIIDNDKAVINRKKEKQKADLEREWNLIYEYREINTDTTHEEIARSLPLLDCTKFLLLMNDFRFNSKLAFGIMSTLRYQRSFTLFLEWAGNPVDKLIYRGVATDFDNTISINSTDHKGGSFYKTEDRLFLDSLSQNGKSNTFKDVYCFNEQYEIQNIDKTNNQIIKDDKFEINRADYVRFIQDVDYIKPDLNRRLLEHSINPEYTKGVGRPSYSILQLKQQYEKIISGEWGEHYLILKDDKADDRQALIKLFDTLINEENE